MTRHRAALPVLLVGLILGSVMGYFDSRPTWDDTGVTAGVIFLGSAILSFLAPRLALPIGLAVGLPIFLFNALVSHNLASWAATAVALAGAGVGFLASRFSPRVEPK